MPAPKSARLVSVRVLSGAASVVKLQLAAVPSWLPARSATLAATVAV